MWNSQKKTPTLSQFAYLPTHEVVNAEGQVADRPFSESFRVSETERIGQGGHRLDPRGRGLSRSPRKPSPRRSGRLGEISTPIVLVVVFDSVFG